MTTSMLQMPTCRDLLLRVRQRRIHAAGRACKHSTLVGVALVADRLLQLVCTESFGFGAACHTRIGLALLYWL